MDRNKDRNFNLPHAYNSKPVFRPVQIQTTNQPKLDNPSLQPSSLHDNPLRSQQLNIVSKFFNLTPLWVRTIIGVVLLVLLAEMMMPLYQGKKTEDKYDLSEVQSILLTPPVDLYAEKLVYSQAEQKYIYNKNYQGASDVAGQSSGPKIIAEFASGDKKTVTVTDPTTKVSMSFTPKFGVDSPRKNQNRVIYPLKNLDASKVYTLKGIGVKEDIILHKFQGNTLDFDYDVELSPGLEARLELSGALGVYGVENALLGNVTAGSEQDQALLKKARENGKKSQLLFTVPAPYVVEADKKPSKAKVSYKLDGKNLNIHVEDLEKATYPLSIDPSVYVETAKKLMRGNNESNIDFDVDNELIQKSQTTGARIDAWSSTTNLSNAVWGQGTAVAGGYIYSAGGVGSSATTTTSFTTAGNDSFVVPSGITSITVKAWGGAGGGGAGNGNSGVGGTGGGGGYAKAVINVTPGETLTLRIGAGGAKATANQRGGSGGEASKVQRSSTILVEAGAGAGGGGRRGNTSGTEGDGGAGGGTTGQQGRAGSTGPPGLGGTQSAGGTGGNGTGDGATGVSQGGGNGSGTTACNNNVTGTGSNGTGGTGGTFTTTCQGGGGGGGGYYGGGGGATSSSNNTSAGGGGGGSSYINPTGLVAGTDVNTVGSYQTPGNSGDSDRGGFADGGAGASTFGAATAGEQGIIVISYTTPGTVTNAVSWAKFNPSNNSIESPNPGTGACSGWCSDSAYYLPTALSDLSLVAYNGYLYAIGGANSSGTPQTTVYIAKLGANGEPQLWHPTGGTPAYWYSDTALSNARSKFAAVAYKNKMYILGGLTTSSTVLGSNTVQYATINPNGTLSTWTTTGMQALSTARYGLTAHIYNDTLYAIGGDATFSGTPVTTVEYSKLNSDGTMNSWTATNSLITSGRLTGGGSFSTVFGGYIYVAGGCTAVNASGYCTSIASDVQLASINADGSLAEWNTIIGLTNDRFAHTLIAWQGGLYRLGGCRAQDASSGGCTNTALDVDYGVINPDGEASTVASSSASGAGTCSGSDPYYCDTPSSIGNMLNATVLLNGYLYIMGGCTNNACTSYSNGVTYQAVGSDGRLQRPASCAGTYTDSYCVSNVTLPSARGAAGVTVFNNIIYLVGGFPTIADISQVNVNPDGSLGTWTDTDFTDITTGGVDDDLSYTFAYARANPANAGSVPGNLFIFGGCTGTTSGIGCSSYSDSVYKCNLSTTGVPSACNVSGQLQIGTVTGNDGNPTTGGLGAHAGAVYANYIYLMGGLSGGTNGTDLTYVRYAKFDDSNNVVAVSGADWVEGTNEMNTGRRRGAGFGYNGFLYVLGGYDGADAIADIEFAKINVSDGSWEAFDTSSVSIQKRWALTTVVSNSYAYVVGGCTAGPAPGGCTTRTNTIQTFQIYNNNSGAPVQYSSSGNQFTTDRLGAGTAIYNGFMYVAGGCISTTTDCDNATNNVQFSALDAYGNLGTWNNTTDSTLPADVAHGKLLEAGGTLYWIGGQNDGGTAQSAVYYGVPDPSTGNVASWNTATNGLPAARTKFGAASWNDRLYVLGGLDASSADQTTVYVSPTVSSTTSGGDIGSAWASSTAFDTARSGTMAVAYANNLYLFGGYDGANYLNDAQFTQINSDGTVDAWTFTTSLPTPLSQGDGFAANGYVYLVGGRSSDTRCVSKTLVAPISANTTIATGNNPTGVGEWYETNIRYDGQRYANSVAYANGKYYVSGGVCNGFPTVSDRLTQSFSTATTAHAVTMPSTVNSGDLLMVLFSNDGNATVTTPSGWTAPSAPNNTQVRGTAARGSVFIKVAAGTEDGTTVDFATSASEEAEAQVYRIKAGDWYGTTAGVEVANGGDPGATTTTPDPPALNPGGWGTENTLWIAYAAGSSYTATTTYPTNYTSGVHELSNTGTGGASASSATRESNTASENPGTFTMSTNSDGIAFTIAIRPVAFGLTGSNKIVQTAVYSQPQVAMYSRMIDTDTDVFPNTWLMNGLDNSIGARWQVKYRSMHDTNSTTDTVAGTLQQNPNEDCGTSATMPVMTTWGQETNFGDVTLGKVETYTPKNSSGGNINCARYYYFDVSIDASQTFGYPEDVTRGPTIADLSLFFTSDPSKRLRHGKTFTGGEQQPLDTPF